MKGLTRKRGPWYHVTNKPSDYKKDDIYTEDPIVVLKSIGPKIAEKMTTEKGIKTIADLHKFKDCSVKELAEKVKVVEISVKKNQRSYRTNKEND